jgi:hypothetical protein
MPATALLLALFAVAPPSEPEAPAPPIRSSVSFVTSFGGPLGFAGIESVTRVAPWLEISGGLGLGWAAADSEPNPGLGHMLQWSVMPRLLLGNEVGGLTIGAGVSGGNYSDEFFCIDDDCPSTYPVSYTLWGNAELGGEAWTPSGVALRIFAGWAHALWANGTHGSASTDFPYLGGGVGYAF